MQEQTAQGQSKAAEPSSALSARARVGVRVLEAGTVAGLVIYGAYLLIHDPAAGPSAIFDRALYCALIMAGAALCFLRAWLLTGERWAWVMLGLYLGVWGAGEIYWAAITANDPAEPYPAPDDAIILASYPFGFLGIALLVRDRVRRFNALTWLDGAIAGLTVAAFGAAFLLPQVLNALEGPALADAVTLAYPVLDTLLLGFLVGVLVLAGRRTDLSWILIAACFAIQPLVDGYESYRSATETYVEGQLWDLAFPAAAVVLGLAAFRPSGREDAPRLSGWRSVGTPGYFALAAGGLLLYGYAAELDAVAVLLAGAALLLAIARLAITYRDNQKLLVKSQRDHLTGLRNRSALMLDLHDCFADHNGPGSWSLAMLDLNGFKQYNDIFGHPAGDALLTRLAGHFEAATGPHGKAYRIGGDEFCALLECEPEQRQTVLARAAAALAERSDAFEVSAARGVVGLGDEASDPAAALQIADRRMYENKAGSRRSARTQAHEVLMRVLRERQPELGTHVDRVTELAGAVCRRLGIEGEEFDVIARAAALHDIGKLAIPDAVLEKPTELEPDERAFIREHTVIGERILREAPALTPVAELVRSSHERWDGDGYPDGLSGEQIPLGSRIIFVCDAFHAMSSDRPYAAAVSAEDAIAELRRCAGSQFDPEVVDAFCRELGVLPAFASDQAPGVPLSGSGH